MKIRLLFMLFIIPTTTIFCQNVRDKFIRDSIVSYVTTFSNDPNETKFEKLKKSIEKLEKDYNTYEPDFRYHLLLQNAYNLNKIDFFKDQLTILVEKYGFDVAYMTEKESYYNNIMKGLFRLGLRKCI
ncbi:MAG: hypothetical protein ABI549_05015 [Flavobacterium sp.]|uniref:hypothetical protein n=1 Tax=Flavobacterium sp. TaxID=239 RepID=UPI0032637970